MVSEQCQRELDAAASLNKLIIPVALRRTDPRGADKRLRVPNWIFFTPDRDLGKSLGLVLRALDDDLPWRDDHARLAVRADEWDHSEPKRDRSFLLRGLDLRTAREWLAHVAEHEKVPPTKLQVEYILASRKAAIRTRRTGVIALITVLAVVLGFVTYGITQGQQASRQSNAAASRQLINESEALGDVSPVISRLESIAAWAINPSSNARYAMLAAAARPGIAVLAGHGFPVQAIAFSPGGRLLAVIDNDHSLHLWNVATRQPLGAPLTGAVNSAAFSPDGTLLAAGGSDHTVRLWDVTTRRQAYDLRAGTATIDSVAFSPDGTLLAAGGSDHTVRLWNVATRQPLGAPLTGHAGAVESVAFSPDGTMLASGGDDHTVRLWDVATRQPVGVPLTGHTGLVDSVAFSPDGTMLASGGFDGTVRLWDVASAASRAPADRPRRARRFCAVQPRREDPGRRGQRRICPVVGRGDRPARGRSARASGRSGRLGGVQPGRHPPGHWRRRWHGPAVGSRHPPPRRQPRDPSALADRVGNVQPRRNDPRHRRLSDAAAVGRGPAAADQRPSHPSQGRDLRGGVRP